MNDSDSPDLESTLFRTSHLPSSFQSTYEALLIFAPQTFHLFNHLSTMKSSSSSILVSIMATFHVTSADSWPPTARTQSPWRVESNRASATSTSAIGAGTPRSAQVSFKMTGEYSLMERIIKDHPLWLSLTRMVLDTCTSPRMASTDGARSVLDRPWLFRSIMPLLCKILSNGMISMCMLYCSLGHSEIRQADCIKAQVERSTCCCADSMVAKDFFRCDIDIKFIRVKAVLLFWVAVEDNVWALQVWTANSNLNKLVKWQSSTISWPWKPVLNICCRKSAVRIQSNRSPRVGVVNDQEPLIGKPS